MIRYCSLKYQSVSEKSFPASAFPILYPLGTYARKHFSNMLQGIHHKLGINSLCYAFYGMKCEACPKGDDVSYHSGCEMGSACLKPEVQRRSEERRVGKECL